MSYAIRVENLGKRYQLGMTHAGSMRELVNRTVGRLLGRKHAALPHEVAEWTSGRQDVDPDGSFWALRDVSFEVKPGEVVGIIGRNGAGKSTLLKILSRITSPTHGRVELHGRVASLLEVGTGFHQELSGRENVFLNGAILGMTKLEIRRKFDEIVAFAEIEEFIDTPVKRYSSGMYVRLAFAVAAHLQPEILLVDEVLAVGDLEFQKKCLGKMEKVAADGKTIFFVSHNMGSVRALCSGAILLENGAIQARGACETVVSAYLGKAQIEKAARQITLADHLRGGEKLSIREVRLVNCVEERFSVYWQQPIAVEVEFEAKLELENVSFGAGIKLNDGTWGFCAHHDDETPGRRWHLFPGRYRLEFTLENPLKPGVYKLGIGAHQEHYSRTLAHTEVINLEVLDHTEQGQMPLIYNTGLINGVATWGEPEKLEIGTGI
jgi:lipopolysaccharide transport system ATP-binding protein